MPFNNYKRFLKMLSGSFYDIQSFTIPDPDNALQEFVMIAALNPADPIFGGHFPGNPVVPGVCQVQMIREVVEMALGRPVRLVESDNIKFLAIINPEKAPLVELKVIIKPATNQLHSVTASIISGETVFLKFKGIFEPE